MRGSFFEVYYYFFFRFATLRFLGAAFLAAGFRFAATFRLAGFRFFAVGIVCTSFLIEDISFDMTMVHPKSFFILHDKHGCKII